MAVEWRRDCEHKSASPGLTVSLTFLGTVIYTPSGGRRSLARSNTKVLSRHYTSSSQHQSKYPPFTALMRIPDLIVHDSSVHLNPIFIKRVAIFLQNIIYNNRVNTG